MAEEALAFHIEGLVEDNEAIATLEAIMADPANRDRVAILVAAKTQAPKAVRVNVTFPKTCSRKSIVTPKRTGSRARAS